MTIERYADADGTTFHIRIRRFVVTFGIDKDRSHFIARWGMLKAH